jgi:hypothetical protein
MPRPDDKFRYFDWGAFGSQVITTGNGGGIPDTPIDPHFFLGGPATGSSPAIPTFRALVADDTAYAPALSRSNVFTNVNKIPGIRVNVATRTSDFTLVATDFENWADATAGQITGTLPAALGTGQIYRVKKGDQTVNLVIVNAAAGDLIDGEPQVVLRDWKDELVVIDAGLHVWDKFNAPPPEPIDTSDFARLSLPNIFTALNRFSGLALEPRLITTDGVILRTEDSEILVDATLADLDLFLPPSIGLGQWYHIKKIDTTSHIISIIANGTDLIDGAGSVNLEQQWADCTVMDAQTGYWDNVGAGPPVEIPTVFQIGRWARFVEINSPNGLAIEIFDGTNWVVRGSWTI